MKLTLLMCFSVLLPIAAHAESIAVPTPLQPFVLKGYEAIALAKADLDGEGREDYLLVLNKVHPADDHFSEEPRPLLLIQQDKDGQFHLVKRNDKLVLCEGCGGIFGDPFSGITAKRKSFTVSHYGGSSWRWTNDYTFSYSRIDKTWQLVRAEESSFHTSDPNKVKIKVYTPPLDFGKIDLADFDPEHYLKRPR